MSNISITDSEQRELVQAVEQVARSNNWSARDLLGIMSFETKGKLDPWTPGPTTQWGRHRGLIQWGKPQREKYGVTKETSITKQVKAVAEYMKDRGVKKGATGVEMYASINAGHASKTDARDAHNGGTWGTVADKFNHQMASHMSAAEALIGKYGGVISQTIDPAQFQYASSTTPTPVQADRSIDTSIAPDFANASTVGLIGTPAQPATSAQDLMQVASLDPSIGLSTNFDPNISGLLSPSSEFTAPSRMNGVPETSTQTTNPFGIDEVARSTGIIGTPTSAMAGIDSPSKSPGYSAPEMAAASQAPETSGILGVQTSPNQSMSEFQASVNQVAPQQQAAPSQPSIDTSAASYGYQDVAPVAPAAQDYSASVGTQSTPTGMEMVSAPGFTNATGLAGIDFSNPANIEANTTAPPGLGLAGQAVPANISPATQPSANITAVSPEAVNPATGLAASKEKALDAEIGKLGGIKGTTSRSNSLGISKNAIGGAMAGGILGGPLGAAIGGILGNSLGSSSVSGIGNAVSGILGVFGGKGPSEGFASAGQPNGQYGGYGDGGGFGAQSYGHGGASQGMGGFEQFGAGFVGPGSGGWADHGGGFGQGSAADLGT